MAGEEKGQRIRKDKSGDKQQSLFNKAKVEIYRQELEKLVAGPDVLWDELLIHEKRKELMEAKQSLPPKPTQKLNNLPTHFQ